jgi:hypothetical protein
VGRNVAVGRLFRTNSADVVSPTNSSSGSGMTPILPIVLGAIVVGLGVLTRRFAFARK